MCGGGVLPGSDSRMWFFGLGGAVILAELNKIPAYEGKRWGMPSLAHTI
jgi:hypothetical protein